MHTASSEFALKHLLVHNRVEQWRVIVDLEDCSFTNMPVSILKTVCDALMVRETRFLGKKSKSKTPSKMREKLHSVLNSSCGCLRETTEGDWRPC